MKKALSNGTIIFALVISFGVIIFGQGRPLLGGYKAAKTDDPGVVEAADFAIEKRAKDTEQEELTLDSIDKAETQSVAGINYRLCLSVSIEDESQQVEVVVNKNLQKALSLTSWTVKDCAESESASTAENQSVFLQNARFVYQSKIAAPVCTGNQLSFREADGDADMGGKRFGNYVFTNTSAASCTLSGFPGFVLLNRSGRIMKGVSVSYNHNLLFESEGRKKPQRVTLEPGKTAWFQIYYNDGMALGLKRPPPESYKVKVKAPHTTREFVIKSAIGAYRTVMVSSVRTGLPNEN